MELQKWLYNFSLLAKIAYQSIRKKFMRPQNNEPFLIFCLLLFK